MQSTLRVRPPAVAGTFYPDDPAELRATVDGLLAEARTRGRGGDATACPKALIVPHAGYVYSGPIAASAFARLVPFADRIARVVVIAPAHRVPIAGLASPGADALRTPLGDALVDLGALASVPAVGESPRAHAREHALEVELPFLQRVVPHARIVPLVVGDAAPDEVADVLDALWGGPETVIVVSSDLSHYLPYAVGRQKDEGTAARVLALDPRPLGGDEACGAAGINGLLRVARRRGLRPELLDLRSSGDTAGGRGGVVGYGAFAFHEEQGS